MDFIKCSYITCYIKLKLKLYMTLSVPIDKLRQSNVKTNFKCSSLWNSTLDCCCYVYSNCIDTILTFILSTRETTGQFLITNNDKLSSFFRSFIKRYNDTNVIFTHLRLTSDGVWLYYCCSWKETLTPVFISWFQLKTCHEYNKQTNMILNIHFLTLCEDMYSIRKKNSDCKQF